MELDLKNLMPKSELNSDFWVHKHGEVKLDEQTRVKLLEIALSFAEDLGLDPEQLEDVIITGSIANYNWSKYSDVDLHLLIDFTKVPTSEKFLEDYYKAKKNLWNDLHDIRMHGHDVEVYAQNVDEPHHATGMYSVMSDQWLRRPKNEEFKMFDKTDLKNKTKDIMKYIDHIEDHLKQDDNLHAMRLSDRLQDRLKKFRTAGLERGGEFSIENLTYKLLRRAGYLDKLYDIENQAFDRIMSIP